MKRLISVALLMALPALCRAWQEPTYVSSTSGVNMLAGSVAWGQQTPPIVLLYGHSSAAAGTALYVRVNSTSFGVMTSMTGTGRLNYIQVNQGDQGNILKPWYVSGTITVASGKDPIAVGLDPSASVGIDPNRNLVNLGTLGAPGLSSSVALDGAVSAITSTPFTAGASATAVLVVPCGAKWISIRVTGTSTNYIRAALITAGQTPAAAYMNYLVNAGTSITFPPLRIGVQGGTIYVGQGEAGGGNIVGSASYGL